MNYKKNKKRKTKRISVRKRLLFEGFIAGIIFGISAHLGFSVDVGDLKIKLFESVCTIVNTNLNCGKIAALFSLLALLLTGISMILELRKLKKTKYFAWLRLPPWAEGLAFYIIGLVVGLVLLGVIIILL